MTTAAGRRLAKLEGALLPREAVLAWLVHVLGRQVMHARGPSIGSVVQSALGKCRMEGAAHPIAIPIQP